MYKSSAHFTSLSRYSSLLRRNTLLKLLRISSYAQVYLIVAIRYAMKAIQSTEPTSCYASC